MEETGKMYFFQFLQEETGRNACNQRCIANKVLERSFPNTFEVIGTSMPICISQNSGILQVSIDLLSNDCMPYGYTFFQFKSFLQNCVEMHKPCTKEWIRD